MLNISERHMKKAKIKALKQLSEMLPKSITTVIESHVCKGKELPEHLVKNSKFEIDGEKHYTYKNRKVVEINHLNRLQKAFARNKEQGLADYIMWLDANNKRMNELFESLNLSQVSEDLKGIAQKGGSGFWSSLMAFLFSFYTAFVNKNKTLKAA